MIQTTASTIAPFLYDAASAVESAIGLIAGSVILLLAIVKLFKAVKGADNVGTAIAAKGKAEIAAIILGSLLMLNKTVWSIDKIVEGLLWVVEAILPG